MSIVVPLYRNRETLRELYSRLAALRSASRRVQLIFVDDNCPDCSGECLRTDAVNDPDLTVIALSGNKGQQTAVVVGTAFATGEVIVTMDGDLQDRPEDVEKLLSEIESGADFAVAVRSIRFQSRSRAATSRVFKSVMSLVSGLPHNYGMFCAADRRLYEQGVWPYASQSPYIPGLLALASRRHVAVPIERRHRPIGRSAYSSIDRVILGIRSINSVMMRRASSRRFRKFAEFTLAPPKWVVQDGREITISATTIHNWSPLR